MNDSSSVAHLNQVALIKGHTPKKVISEGISKLGGISKLINKGDHIFIKINLKAPNGFPTNTNFETLSSVVSLCNDAGAKEINVGCFPAKFNKIENITHGLDLQSLLSPYGAKLLLLNEEHQYSYKTITLNNKEFRIPSVILDSDKMISINQVNVDPIFKLTLGILNSYTIVPNEFQEIKKNEREGKDYLSCDQYKKDLISNILDVFTIKKPNLLINDLFYILEGAGPLIYKDSILKKTGFMVMGNDAVAVDTITLKLLNIGIDKSNLLAVAQDRKIGTTEISKIEVIGENLDNYRLNIKHCQSRLEDLEIFNTDIKKGRFCSGCFNQAYHLLNVMKSNMTKDLKYIIRQSLLVGQNPQEPESLENILVFGDCAINSTIDHSFRKIKMQKGKKLIEATKNKIKREKKQKPKQKVKVISNKKILELPGCPPNLLECIYLLIDYYGKDKVPGLNLYYNLLDTYINLKEIETMEKRREKHR